MPSCPEKVLGDCLQSRNVHFGTSGDSSFYFTKQKLSLIVPLFRVEIYFVTDSLLHCLVFTIETQSFYSSLLPAIPPAVSHLTLSSSAHFPFLFRQMYRIFRLADHTTRYKRHLHPLSQIHFCRTAAWRINTNGFVRFVQTTLLNPSKCPRNHLLPEADALCRTVCHDPEIFHQARADISSARRPRISAPHTRSVCSSRFFLFRRYETPYGTMSVDCDQMEPANRLQYARFLTIHDPWNEHIHRRDSL